MFPITISTTLATSLFLTAIIREERWFVAGQNVFNPITPGVRQLANDLLKNGTIPGLSLAVVHLNGSLDSADFGVKNEDGDQMTVDTLFGLASCSKAFLASSFGILIDDFANGRNVTPLPDGVETLDWRTKIRDVLTDDWKLQDRWTTEKADFRDLLSHQSGFPRHDLSYQPIDTPLDVIRRQRYLRTAFELRQRYHYNNQMYILAAHVISTLSKTPYTKFVQERIWDPLNMTYTTFNSSKASQKGLLTQSWTTSGRRIPYWFSEEAVPLVAGPMGIISNVIDLSKWVRTLLNGGVDPTTNITIVPVSAWQEESSGQIIIDPAPSFPDYSLSAYGHGWMRQSYQGYEILAHAGAIPGFSSYIYLLPSQGLGIIVLGNADNKQNQESAITLRVIEEYLNLPPVASIQYASLSPEFDVPKPKDGRGEVALEKYTGVYRSPGYSEVALCDPRTSTNDSRRCKEILGTYSKLEDVGATNGTLYFALPGVWVSHGRLAYDEGDYFQFTATYLFPDGYGRNKTAFESAVTPQTVGTARFVVSEDESREVTGFGLFGLVGEETNRERWGGTVEETADVWFERIGGL
ncbi:beta-lactamase/transpeptidase-like protein [Irpex rosettiformis]|uniref:Beta-lactamase/transpeptidase-like protein n=1 Tax=Irpex rosettiformis TaxID=378272 RepID=A0ACB8U0I0_9APHY|nr:beta-lactamase/transpeptidase-like protein [Irpex rosettiformis]